MSGKYRSRGTSASLQRKIDNPTEDDSWLSQDLTPKDVKEVDVIENQPLPF